MLTRIRKFFKGIVSGQLNLSFAQRRIEKFSKKLKGTFGDAFLLIPLTGGWLAYLTADYFNLAPKLLDIVKIILWLHTAELAFLFIGALGTDVREGDGEERSNVFFFVIIVCIMLFRWLLIFSLIAGLLVSLLAKILSLIL